MTDPLSFYAFAEHARRNEAIRRAAAANHPSAQQLARAKAVFEFPLSSPVSRRRDGSTDGGHGRQLPRTGRVPHRTIALCALAACVLLLWPSIAGGER